VDAAHATRQFRVQHAVQLADFLIEVACQVPPEIGGLVELVQCVRRVDAAADDFSILLPELVRV
jgi:hypothetical protein